MIQGLCGHLIGAMVDGRNNRNNNEPTLSGIMRFNIQKRYVMTCLPTCKRAALKFALAAMAWLAFMAVPGLAPLAPFGLSGTAAAQTAQGGPEMNIDSFYDALSPYGTWVENSQYGYVWVPEQVPEGWRPYTVGHWLDTDQGWYWDSQEPFAWAIYHYGRWGYSPDYGWFWVPGTQWAPAWVVWRSGDRYVGWAPIPPQGEGYAYGAPTEWAPPVAEAWVFVPPDRFMNDDVASYALDAASLGLAFANAVHVYRPYVYDQRIYNYGIPRAYISQWVGRPIVRINIFRSDNWHRYGYRHFNHNGIYIYAPRFRHQRPYGRPKHFYTHPGQFHPKAFLKHRYPGRPPAGWGHSAFDHHPGHGPGHHPGMGPGGPGHGPGYHPGMGPGGPGHGPGGPGHGPGGPGHGPGGPGHHPGHGPGGPGHGPGGPGYHPGMGPGGPGHGPGGPGHGPGGPGHGHHPGMGKPPMGPGHHPGMGKPRPHHKPQMRPGHRPGMGKPKPHYKPHRGSGQRPPHQGRHGSSRGHQGMNRQRGGSSRHNMGRPRSGGHQGGGGRHRSGGGGGGGHQGKKHKGNRP